MDLVEALDPSKWRLIPHFVDATYEAGGDTAKVVDTLETNNNISGVMAVLTMAGQPPEEPTQFTLATFLEVWVPVVAPIPTAEVVDSEDEAGEEVSDGEVPIPMSIYPKVLAALRAAELLRLEEVDLQRHVAVPWVAAALGEKWKDQEAYELAGFPDTLQRLESGLTEHASPSVNRLKRYAQLGALGSTPQDRGRSVRRLYLDGAAETAARARVEEAEKAKEDAEKRRKRDEAAAARKRRGKANPPGSGRAASDSDASDGSDSGDSSSDSDSDGDLGGRKKKRARRKAKASTRKRASKRSVSGSEFGSTISLSSEVPADETYWQSLRALTPRGDSGIDAARVLFAEQQMRSAAGWVGPAEIPTAAPADPAEVKHLVNRFNLAVVRLEQKIGSQWHPSRRPADVTELREWAEAALHALVGGEFKDGASDADGHDPGVKETKGKKPLAAAARDCAVAPSVVERLHDAAPRVSRALKSPTYTTCPLLFAAQPDEVRRDLQRVAVSNHAVDATGELRRTRTTIPPCAMQVASRVLEAVRKFLLQLVKADVTDSATMKADTARDLAEAAMQGKYRIAAFITAARQLKGPHPPAAGSREELMASFALMRKTWRCVHDQLGWTTLDIDTFDELVNSTGTGFILSVSDLTQYIRCVVDEYFELARSFRLHDGAPPSLAVAIAERKQGYDLKAVRSSILKGQRPQHVATRAASEDDDAPRRRKKRVRPRDRKPVRAADADSSASSSSEDAAAATSPKPAKAGGGVVNLGIG